MIEEQEKKKPKRKEKKKNTWIYKVFFITFVLSLVMGTVADATVENLNVVFAVAILVFIILIGIAFDMIGMSVASADEVVFHARATKKHKGATEAIRLVKDAEKVSSVCNDVVGDVCGIVSGSISALIALRIATMFQLPTSLVSLGMGALVASITVGGKAIGKTIAVKNAENIIGKVGAVISYIFPVKKKI